MYRKNTHCSFVISSFGQKKRAWHRKNRIHKIKVFLCTLHRIAFLLFYFHKTFCSTLQGQGRVGLRCTALSLLSTQQQWTISTITGAYCRGVITPAAKQHVNWNDLILNIEGLVFQMDPNSPENRNGLRDSLTSRELWKFLRLLEKRNVDQRRPQNERIVNKLLNLLYGY